MAALLSITTEAAHGQETSIVTPPIAPELLAPKSPDSLLQWAKEYSRPPVIRNGQPVLDRRTGAPQFRSRFTRGFMRQNCRDISSAEYTQLGVQEWLGTPLESCTYQVRDNFTDADGQTQSRNKSGWVLLVKLSDDLIATWLANTCLEIGLPNAYCIQQLGERIRMQSGAQFPVRGIAYEDQYIKIADGPLGLGEKDPDGQDGLHEPFCFREGVTVYVDAFDARSTDPLTPEQMQACASGPLTSQAKRVGKFARIVGTSAQMYVANGGARRGLTTRFESQTYGTDEWLVTSREEMQRAVQSQQNFMLTAWAKANMRLLR